MSLTVINAYNLIDGVDRLAGSLALIALLAVATVGGASSASGAVALTIAALVAFAWIIAERVRKSKVGGEPGG